MILLVFPLFAAICVLGYEAYLWEKRPQRFGFTDLLSTILATGTVIGCFVVGINYYLGHLFS